MAKLIFIGEKFGDRVYEFAVPTTAVGRGDHNTLTIRDASVSQTHCEILVYGVEVIVRDLGSSNGTFVDGVRLHHQQRALKAGQIVKFGSVEARLELESPSSGEETTDETAIHSYARYRREPRSDPQNPANISMTLQAGSESALADHTLVLPRSHAEETTPPPSPEQARGVEKPAAKTAIALILAALALGLAILLWLIWGRG
jgi:pSer/pThr/pTyr-binding forkhead associated (FHA) protein